MPLVIAVSSSALFDIAQADAVYRSQGVAAYRTHQRAHEHEPYAAGVAMPFVRRLLALRDLDAAHPPVEVVLVSHNDPDTGLRVRASLDHHGLAISRTAFTGGRAPWPYLEAFSSSLFLSANPDDVAAAIKAGHAAGTVLPSISVCDEDDELRVAFDFDGVLAGDESERIYASGGLRAFHTSEREQADLPLSAGPLQALLGHLATLQQLEEARLAADPTYRCRVRIAILTARSAPADRRVVTTLRAWGITVNESFFVGDLPKDRILRAYRPHIFFDDKRANAVQAADVVPAVHVPFGIANA
jgi:5'-nucleotidase